MFTKEKISTPTGLVWDSNMATISLFWDTNMVAVTSCENSLLMYIVCVLVKVMEIISNIFL